MRAVSALLTLCLFGGSPAASGWLAPTAAWPADVPEVTVTVRDGGLALTARSAPIRLVLDEIGKALAASLQVEPAGRLDLARQVTIAVSGGNLESVLRRLLNEENLLVVYSTTDVITVRVFGEQRVGDATQPLPAQNVRGGTRPADIPTTLHPRLAERVRTWSSTPDEEAAARAAEAASVRNALDVLRTETDTRKLEKALDTIQDGGAVEADPLLRFASTPDRDPDLRTHALQVLAEHNRGDARVVALLRTLAEADGNEDVRETARLLLQRFESR
jgi:hypothetical protein